MDDDDFAVIDVPEEWRRLGFTGLFWLDVGFAEGVNIDAYEAKLPCRIPFGTNSCRLALRVNRDQDPPTVTVVWTDAAAIVDLAFNRHRLGA